MRTHAGYYVYALVDPRDDVTRYVGITVDPPTRLRDHIGGVSANDAKDRWVAELKRLGLKPVMRILEEDVSSELVAERERYWMWTFLDAGHPLTNIHIHPHQSFEIRRTGWVSIKEAARQLKISPNKIANLANRGRIRSREDPLDERVRLVELNEIRALFASRKRSSNE